ncbi:15810_t:CDS:2, partial [Funneliformis caledonium]
MLQVLNPLITLLNMNGIDLNLYTMNQTALSSSSPNQEFYYSNDFHMFHITCEENLPDCNTRQNQKIYKVTCKTIPISLVANNLLKRPYTIEFSDAYNQYAINYNQTEDKGTSCRIVVENFDQNSNTREFNATTNESESSQSDDSEANFAGKNNEPP